MEHRSSRRPADPHAGSERVCDARHREEMARAVELLCLRRLGSPLAHDLKNFAARLGFVADNLRDGADEPEVIEACAATVEDTKRRVEEVALSFRDQREALVQRTRGDINRALRSALETTGAHNASGIELQLSIEELPESAIHADGLEQAFGSILHNALQAMPEGGRLEVASHQVEGPGGRPAAEISVTDQGPGMSAEFIEGELFAPFRSTRESGLGLGMFACREIIELHRGSVQVDSLSGRGTTVRVSLPIEPDGGSAA